MTAQLDERGSLGSHVMSGERITNARGWLPQADATDRGTKPLYPTTRYIRTQADPQAHQNKDHMYDLQVSTNERHNGGYPTEPQGASRREATPFHQYYAHKTNGWQQG